MSIPQKSVSQNVYTSTPVSFWTKLISFHGVSQWAKSPKKKNSL